MGSGSHHYVCWGVCHSSNPIGDDRTMFLLSLLREMTEPIRRRQDYVSAVARSHSVGSWDILLKKGMTEGYYSANMQKMQKGVTTSAYCKSTDQVSGDQRGVPIRQAGMQLIHSQHSGSCHWCSDITFMHTLRTSHTVSHNGLLSGSIRPGAEIRLVVVKTGTSKENWAILATARHHPNISAVGAHNFKPARKVKAGLQVVRRKIVMDRAQTLPPRQAVLKMACEFILEPLMDARNRCMLPSDIQQSNPDDLCRDLGEYDISARCPWSDPM